MPIYSRAEFEEICGISPAYFTMNRKRGKILQRSDGTVDSNNVINKAFMSKRTGQPAEVEEAPAPAPEPKAKKEAPITVKKKPAKVVKRSKPPQEQFSEYDQGAQETMIKWNLDQQAKELDIEKKEQEVEINRLKIAKLRGDVIPTDLVKVVFAQHFKSVTTAFHQGCDNFIMTIAKTTGMKREEMANLRGELIDIVNRAVEDGLDESKESIKNIVAEYSDKRGQGERK